MIGWGDFREIADSDLARGRQLSLLDLHDVRILRAERQMRERRAQILRPLFTKPEVQQRASTRRYRLAHARDGAAPASSHLKRIHVGVPKQCCDAIQRFFALLSEHRICQIIQRERIAVPDTDRRLQLVE